MAEKRRDWETPTGATVAGAGGVTAVGGLAAGGIPKAKVDSIKLRHLSQNAAVKQGTKRSRAKEFARNVPKARQGMQGGVGGFRESAHYIAESAKAHEASESGQKSLKRMTKPEAFKHGLLTGHSPPERVIMRQMAGLRRGGNKALVGGLALTAGGAALAHEGGKKKLSKRDNRRTAETASGATLGAGAAGAGAAYGGSKVFASQGRKWEGRAAHSIAEAGKQVPGLGTESKKGTGRLKNRVLPVVRDSAINTDKKLTFGHSKEQIARAGHLRGQAKQQAYFGDVYGAHAKMFRRGVKPALAVAGLGAAGLAASELHRNKKVQKNSRMSAFGVEH